jgi:hypothetical protein
VRSHGVIPAWDRIPILSKYADSIEILSYRCYEITHGPRNRIATQQTAW